tara:strand:- start:8257 stop:8484 length:228 start_codon:yes stop_codon:yes gene_type:complete
MMQHPTFAQPLPSHVRAHLAGEITALECLGAEMRALIAEHAGHEAATPVHRASHDYHRRQKVRAYLKLRGLRRVR